MSAPAEEPGIALGLVTRVLRKGLRYQGRVDEFTPAHAARRAQ